MLLLQEIDIEIKGKNGLEKLVADDLSRMVNKEVTNQNHEVLEKFLDEKILKIEKGQGLHTWKITRLWEYSWKISNGIRGICF